MTFLQIIATILTVMVALYQIFGKIIGYRRRIYLREIGIQFVRLKKLYVDYLKVKHGRERFNNVEKFIGYDKKLYVRRKSNDELRGLLKNYEKDRSIVLIGKSMIGKTTMVLNEILTNRRIRRKYWLFRPKGADALAKWNRKLPFKIDVRKILIFLDDLNEYTPIGGQTFSSIYDIFSNRSPVLIATCRSGDEWKIAEKQFERFFQEQIYLEEITDDEARKLAQNVRDGDFGSFDGSPGSVVLGIKKQRMKIDDLAEHYPQSYAVLQSAVICRHFLWFENFGSELLRAIMKNILEVDISESQYFIQIDKLRNNDLITLSDKGEISIPDPYIDIVLNPLKQHAESLSKKLENFVSGNEDLTKRLARYYSFRLGFALGEKGETDEAIRVFRKAIELKEDYPEAWYNLGVALGKKSEWDEAIKSFRKAIELKEDFPEAWYGFGVTLGKKGEMDEEIKAYQKTIELKEDFPKAWNKLGVVFGEKGKILEEIKAYRKAIELNEDYAEAWINLGFALGEKGKTDEAVEAFLKGLELIKKIPRVAFDLYTALGGKSEVDKIINVFRKAMKLKVYHPEIWNHLDVTLRKKAKWMKQLRRYEKL